MSILYHYTDINGFLSIIQNGKLWLSAANNLNDYRETDWLKIKIKERLEFLAKNNKANINILNEFWHYWTQTNPLHYICSFSKNGDLLSQWRAYSDDGFGIAIGFRRELFDFSPLAPLTSFDPSHTIGLLDVIYKDPAEDFIFQECIKNLCSNLENEETKAMAFLNVATTLRKLSFIYKNPAFVEEDETRIIHTPFITTTGEIGNITINGSISGIKQRISKKNITSYFEYDIYPENKPQLITEIVLGPKCQISEYELDHLFSLKSLKDIIIKRSKASYR